MLEIGKAIHIVRKAKGLRAGELAKRAGISNPFLSLVECGKRQPSLEVVGRLADALGIPVESLVLLAKPGGSSLRSTNRSVLRLATAVEQLAEAEATLRRALEKES